MAKLNYYSNLWRGAYSGGMIFDWKLVEAMRVRRYIETHGVRVSRRLKLPVWDRRIVSIPKTRMGETNVVSHEGLHALAESIPIDCFIVHNYFSEFHFHGFEFVNPLYRLGSEKIFSKIFRSSKRVIFLSAREKRLACENYPEFEHKFTACPPGHDESKEFYGGVRNADVVEMPGTLDWVPKKISYWSNVGRGLRGPESIVHGESDEAYISVIYDSFLSGFKLKLVEMAKHGKAIISFADIQEELNSIGFPDAPYIFVKDRAELREAIIHFQQKGDIPLEAREEFFRRGTAVSWECIAETVLGFRD